MNRYLTLALAGALLPLSHFSSAPAAGAERIPPEQLEFFETKIRPVLVEACYECHSVQALDKKNLKGNLLLDSREASRKGGESGAAVVPGNPGESLLMSALKHESFEMPPDRKLADEVIADFSKWIEMGAPDPREAVAVKLGIDWEAAGKHWSFQPVKPQRLPTPSDPAWSTRMVDRFVFDALEKQELQPVATADKRVLIRRATFDLLGLPPTPDEVKAFVADDSPTAFEKVVSRLLASPHYGERWARHWLDVARYGEDQAVTAGTKPRPMAWRYRDWVVEALNRDLPYDQFVKLQLAADLIVDQDDPKQVKDLAALGFLSLGLQHFIVNDKLQAEANDLDDRVDVVTRGLLGLTVACARCHDHKFDPITMSDYYGLAGMFRSTQFVDARLVPPAKAAPYEETKKLLAAREKQLATFVRRARDETVAKRLERMRSAMTSIWKYEAMQFENPAVELKDFAEESGLPAERLELWQHRLLGKYEKDPLLEAWRRARPKAGGPDKITNEARSAIDQWITTVKAAFAASDDAQQEAVRKRFRDELFRILPVAEADAIAELSPESRRRYDELNREATTLRKRLPAEPPLAHVARDGTGKDMPIYLRGSPHNLGATAERRFLRVLGGDDGATAVSGGSGRLQLAEAIVDRSNPLTARVMVNRIWQHHFGRGLVGTPSNFGTLGERPTHPELLDHLAVLFMKRGWSVKSMHREIMLSRTYQLSSAADEANVARDPDNAWYWRFNRRRLDIEAYRDAMLAVSGELSRRLGGPPENVDSLDSERRTLYAKVSRNKPAALLGLFDFPDANLHNEARSVTTIPQQQLFVLNSPFVIEQARRLAERLRKEGVDDSSRVMQAYALLYGRPASEQELRLALRFLSHVDPAAERDANELTRWERYAQVLLAGNEFLFVD